MSMPVISALDFTGQSLIDDAAEAIRKDSPMKIFYRDKKIFITGGLGFLGQLYIEKLLRCEVKEIYVLVRPKQNKSSLERIRETFVGDVFVKLKAIDPNYLARITLVEGDTSQADLGISQADRKALIENVEIVIHAAADVRFDKPLQELCLTNVRGTKAMTLLAAEMRNLIVFCFVSTAYCQVYREQIEEKFYPPPCDPEELIRISEHFEEHQIDELKFLTDKLIHPWDNTYVFTKSLAEEVVRRSLQKFPAVVVRPSVVISTYEEPIPAWCNNVYGFNGVVVGTGLGFIKVAPCTPHTEVNVICADFVTNGTLAVIYGKANEKRSSKVGNFREQVDESKVIYHLTSQNCLEFRDTFDRMTKLYFEDPSVRTSQCIWIPSMTFTESQLMTFILTILYHVIPSILFDVFFKLTNNRQRLLPSYRKLQDFVNRVLNIGTQHWNFDHKNIKAIMESMCEEDKRFFCCNIFDFSMADYVYTYLLGLKTYILKEPLNNEEAAQRTFLKLRLAYYPLITIYISFLGSIVYFFMRVIGVTSYLTAIYGKLML